MRVYRMPAGATSGAVEVATLDYAVNAPLVSPDGSKFMYFIWGPETRLEGRIHVFDFATGEDVAIMPEDEQAPADITEWENRQLVAGRVTCGLGAVHGHDVNQVAVLPAMASVRRSSWGRASQRAPMASPSGSRRTGSPSSRPIGSTTRPGCCPVDGSEGRLLDWAATEDLDWQRVAR